MIGCFAGVRYHQPDCCCYLVVLHFKVAGADGHGGFHSSQEDQSDLIPTRLPPRFHVLLVVDRSQVGRWRNVYVRLVENFLSLSYCAHCYWHHNVVCLSVCLFVCDAVVHCG